VAFPKAERNQDFLRTWQAGASNRTLAERFGLTIGGVKALKSRLKAKLRGKAESTSTSTVTPEAPGRVEPERKEAVMSPSPSTSTKRMTFWLPVGIIREIKTRAKREKRTASDILREILGEYLKRE